MSFFEGMMLCFLCGWLNSYLYSYHFSKNHKGFLFWFAVIFLGILIILDCLIFFNIINARLFTVIPWIRIPETIVFADVGKYWLFTPGLIFGFPLEFPVINYNGLVWNFYAIIFMISYIWWWVIGQNCGRFMYGRQEYEKGAWYLLRSTKKVKKSRDKLEKKTNNKNDDIIMNDKKKQKKIGFS
ncbi:MAG: hypothetical protein ACFFBP_00220 [Promethearchaeota archaeon]